MENKKTCLPQALVKTGIFVLIIALVLRVVAGILIYRYNKKKQTYIQTVGVVVEYDRKLENGDNGNYYYIYAPIIEFKVDGKEYQEKYNVYSMHPPKKGSKISLRYNKENPEDVVFDKDKTRVVVPICAGVFLIFGVVLIVVGKKRLKAENIL